ncbi:heme A synthase [Solimonas sp. K1W22B-7]|uniref:COX15/CtaA family protein n=1 Tax=Solimonas sp. K1W22B-7 TaxID=2303331 RepID=UPI000E32D96F|nr:COX15/CtaA family protein [Solimonas sp. K1W22B-7]AXQ27687.1 heme A synthase [Solimonas sp. K1W22B-7]
MSWFRRINFLALCLCFGVVVLGAFVRLSDAGLGCPDWPGCYGHLGVPQEAHDVARAEQNFPQRPVEAHKAWKEMIHRYFASTLGLLIVALAVMSGKLRHRGAPQVLPLVLAGLVVFQGLLGMWTVTKLLKPLIVTAHLIGGMSTLALLAWMWLATGRREEAATGKLAAHRSERQLAIELQRAAAVEGPAPLPLPPAGLRRYALVALLLVILQIFLGGWTSTNYAALACPDLPTCHGKWLPELDVPTAFTLWHGLGIDYEHGILDARARVTIHFFHRAGAVVVTAALLLLGLFLWRRGGFRLWRGYGVAVIGALALQVSIGLSIVKLQLPLGLATAHNAGAAVLLLTLVSLNFFAWKASR